VVLALCAAVWLWADPVRGAQGSAEEASKAASDEKRQPGPVCGVEPVAARLAGAGGFVDFRYRVKDVEAARQVLSRQNQAGLVHRETGRRLPVAANKLGRIRQVTGTPEVNRDYFILFSNVGRLVKVNDRVDVVIGECRLEGLNVQ
jgi:hypothetical protein